MSRKDSGSDGMGNDHDSRSSTLIPDGDSRVMRILQTIVDHGVRGCERLPGAEALAWEYLRDPAYASTEQRVTALIRWESAKAVGLGFATGLGGMITLPASLPASLCTSWVLQARLVGAIACLHGHSLEEDRVRTLIMLCIVGGSCAEPVKEAATKTGERLLEQVIRKVPGSVLRQINRKVGFRFVTKAGTTGVINLTKLIPVAGGMVGGAAGCAACMATGRLAHRIFRNLDRTWTGGGESPIPAGPVPMHPELPAEHEALAA
jgi:hypothetical protein